MTAADDTRAMTYAELGKVRGISPASAKRLALRHGWHKEPGNDGLARVRVPATWLETPPATEAIRHPGDTSPATVPVATLARVQQDAESAIRAAEAERDAARQEAQQEREGRARAEGERDGLREALRRADAAVAEGNRRMDEAGVRLRDSAERLERAQAATAEARERLELLRREREVEAAALRDGEASARGQVAQERQAREAVERELAEWMAGSPLARAWRALAFRRGRP